MKKNTNKLIWDITNVKSVEDIKPSLTKAKILNSGINISELGIALMILLSSIFNTEALI